MGQENVSSAALCRSTEEAMQVKWNYYYLSLVFFFSCMCSTQMLQPAF
jgi:hypothetical protein